MTDDASRKTRRGARRKVQALEIAQAPLVVDDQNIGYLCSQLIMCTLPHSDPGPVPVWTRRDGMFTLSIQAGFDRDGRCYGLPYGSIPRLVLVWLISEAVRKGPVVEVGYSLSDFLFRLG